MIKCKYQLIKPIKIGVKILKNDLRIEKTRNLIIETFKTLLCEKDYEDITIKELTEKAKINKSTFYRHYSSLDKLMDTLQDEIVYEFMKRIADYKVPEQLEEINKEFFLFSEENDKIYEKMIFNKNYEYLKQKTINNFMNKVWKSSEFFKKLSAGKKNIFLTYIQTTGLEIYKQWVLDNKKIPLEEIIELSNRIIRDGVQVFLEDNKNF